MSKTNKNWVIMYITKCLLSIVLFLYNNNKYKTLKNDVTINTKYDAIIGIGIINIPNPCEGKFIIIVKDVNPTKFNIQNGINPSFIVLVNNFSDNKSFWINIFTAFMILIMVMVINNRNHVPHMENIIKIILSVSTFSPDIKFLNVITRKTSKNMIKILFRYSETKNAYIPFIYLPHNLNFILFLFICQYKFKYNYLLHITTFYDIGEFYLP
jgi:hypothetical protein